ncbi:uncharacterized protein LOC130758495 [Actinidia eriantha]|uniref:uncharacterized protein LOC130758495 n=1 Tax=Actinidia eriantha TaxID=165200 RepID=UPI00258AE766|nr:uncharacterized protein LOC130758495 [Actinidia eriantha]
MYIVAHTPPDFKPNIDRRDCVIWSPAAASTFSVQNAWRAIKILQPKVPWGPIIWFKGQVPRWAFIIRLCCLGRLATKDRLNGWGMAVDPTCVLCHQADHLFFNCSFSGQIWTRMLAKVQVNRSPSSWDFQLQWAILNKSKACFSSCLYNLGLSADFYHICGERNARVFCNNARGVNSVLRNIERDVRYRSCSWERVENTDSNWLFCLAWDLHKYFGGH